MNYVKCKRCLNWLEPATMEVAERGMMVLKAGYWCPHCQVFEYTQVSASANE